MNNYTVEGLAEAYWQAREKRLELSRELKKLEDSESACKQAFLEHCIENELEGCVTGGRNFVLKLKKKKVIENFGDLWDFITTNDAHELLQRRLSEQAIKEYEEAGVHIPGISEIKVTQVSSTKVN